MAKRPGIINRPTKNKKIEVEEKLSELKMFENELIKKYDWFTLGEVGSKKSDISEVHVFDGVKKYGILKEKK